MEGMKKDKGKLPIAQMLFDYGKAVEEMTKVWAMGANKYAKSNWKYVDNAVDRYSDALMRHLMQAQYEPVDSESGITHYAHVAVNAMFLLWFELNKKGEKDANKRKTTTNLR